MNRDLGPEPSYVQASRLPLLIAAASVCTCAALSIWLGQDVRNPKGSLEHLLSGPLKALVALSAISIAASYVRARRGHPFSWSWQRLGWTASMFTAFVIVYVCYRNIKGWVPLGRADHYDRQLGAIDRAIFAGEPSERLSAVLGHGHAAGFIDFIYMSYLPLVWISVAAALALMTPLRHRAAFMTAYCLNWLLGAVMYWALPSVGPAFTDPERFAWMNLTATGSASLQDSLWTKRVLALADADVLQGIGAFPSLHTSVTLTWAVILTMMGYRWLSAVAWGYCALTMTATLYFGWHYSLDLAAGCVIALVSCVIARRCYLTADARIALAKNPQTAQDPLSQAA